MFTVKPVILLTAVKDAIDAGAGPGVLSIYTGPQPDPGAAVTTQTLLAALACADPCGTVAGSTLTLTINDDQAADDTGTAVWARITDSDGNWVADMDVGNEASGAALKLNTVQIVAGGTVRITSATISV